MTPPKPLTCGRFRAILHDYYVGRLDPPTVAALRAHRGACVDCDRLMQLAEEMTCREFTELLNDYVEEQLPAERREVFDRHLSICPDCTHYLQSYRATLRMSAFAMKDALRRAGEELPQELVDAILAARGEEEKKRKDE